MIQSGDARGCRGIAALALLFLSQEAAECIAQVVLDGKFGTSGALTGPQYQIPQEAGSVRGNNLFHSFQQFDLGANDVASFSGAANIQNILARVTGGNASSIDGTIRSEISGANFFFINPQGVIFGPNARVDVSGSFAFSSADYLKLADGARFVASLDADDSVLSTAPVSAFGFINSAPGSLQLQQTSLLVSEGQKISLVGGEITLEGASVQAPGGDINVVAVSSPGEVPVNASYLNPAGFAAAFPNAGAIGMSGGAKLDTSGEGGGRIVIRGGSLVVDKSKIEANSLGFGDGRGIDVGVAGDLTLSNGGQINSLSPSGLGASGNIDISAGAVRLIGDGTVDYFFNPSTQISSSTGDLFFGGGAAKGGDISIKTGILEVGNSAQISSATFGMGDAGRIEIEASSLRLNAQMVTLAQITANTQLIYGGGRAGDIIIRADNLTLENGAAILAATFGTGAAGVIDIETQSMEVLSGAIISAGTFGSADGGNVEVTANKLRIDGRDTFFGGPDLITGIQAVTGGPARGGTININAESIEMVHMGTMFTSSLFGEGPGGNIEIQTGSLTLGSGATIRAAGEAIGPAGQISINARGSVTLEGGSSIATSAPMSSGGDIHVSTGADLRLVDSEINAQAGLDGGNITVSAADLIYLLNSRLTAQADTTGSGFGNGGNLVIGPSSFLILNEGALVSKSSLGNGGNITILSDYFFQSESLIDASAPFGLPGTVIVTAPDVDLSASLIGLPGDLLDAASELRPDCAIRLSDGVSSFVVLGRGGLPIQPGGFLPSGMVPLRHEPK